ncbi:MAG TPA: LptA/OstA family protein [Candidatus Polarisedimenticolia bacterium]|nr:LptA/OstA family protein [Candidatus Polarisedimenticolia bacterium]
MALARSLRFVLLLGLAALVGGIVLSISASSRLANLPDLPSTAAGDRIFQQGRDVTILRTRRGAPTLKLSAERSSTFIDGEMALSEVTFRLYGAGGGETVVESPHARSSPTAEAAAAPGAEPDGAPPPRTVPELPSMERIGSWILEGGVTVKGAGDLTLETSALAYFEAEGQARTNERVTFTRGPAAGRATGLIYEVESQRVRFLQAVAAEMTIAGLGVVKVTAGEAAHDLNSGTFAMRGYEARTERGEVLSGTRLVAHLRQDGGLERLEGEEGFVLESTHAIEGAGGASPLSRLLALEGRRTMRGQSLAIVFDQNEAPASIEVAGDANLTATGLGGDEAPASIQAETLTFDLHNGSLTRALAEGEVDLKGIREEGKAAGFHLLSRSLVAVLDPNLGSILSLEGAGEIRLSDQGMESQGSRTYLDPNTDVITLSGEADAPASALWLGRRIEAQRIEADRRRKTLSARGGVRASYRPDASRPEDSARERQPLPFFRTGETVYVMASALTFSEQGRLAQYRDDVRLWQGDSRVEADEVDVNEPAGSLDARGDVVSTFRQPAPASLPAPANPSEEIVTVASSTMRYDHTEGKIRYSGRVLITQGPTRINADSVTVTLAAGGGSAETIEAGGNIELTDRGRSGTGDHLVADLRANTLKLTGTGRQAIVQDESGQQVVRGIALTMDRSSDRILVESELGGRTWITLKPRQKGEPGVGSNPQH